MIRNTLVAIAFVLGFATSFTASAQNYAPVVIKPGCNPTTRHCPSNDTKQIEPVSGGYIYSSDYRQVCDDLKTKEMEIACLRDRLAHTAGRLSVLEEQAYYNNR